MANDTSVNAITFCDLLYRIKAKYPDKIVHLFLDNAVYQKNKMVRSFAESLGIELHYLPTYSPILNYIERLWKFVKSKLRTEVL